MTIRIHLGCMQNGHKMEAGDIIYDIYSVCTNHLF